MEVVDLNEPVLLLVQLVEAVLQREASLHQYLNQVVEDLILSVLHFALLLKVCKSRHVVALVKFFELPVGDDAVAVGVYLVEQSASFVVFDSEVEQARETQMEVTQRQVALLKAVHPCESNVHRQFLPDLELDGAEHLDPLRLLLELALDAFVRQCDIVRDSLRDRWHGDTPHVDAVFRLGGVPSTASPLLAVIFVRVGCPEARQELSLAQIGLFAAPYPLQEDLQLLVGETELEAVDGGLELFEADRLRVVSVDQVEALFDRLVVLH